jgi:hypothetical protein
MGNYNCEICGTAIIEGRSGHYITECEHYPLKKFENKTIITNKDFQDRLKKGDSIDFNYQKLIDAVSDID